MTLVQRANIRHRLRIAAAAVIAALAVVMAGASVAAPMGASVQRPTPPGASSGPGIQFPGFVRDRGRYTPLVVPGAVTQTFPLGINNRGQIVGYYDDAGGVHGFLRQRDGSYSGVDVPGAKGTEAFEINDRGQIVGIYSETASSDFSRGRGFLLGRRQLIRIDVPGALKTEAAGVNNRGQVVGDYIDAGGGFHGFLWDKGRFTTIDVPGAGATNATDINDRGEIVGVYTEGPSGTGPARGFLLRWGVYITFAAPDAPVTAPYCINNRSQIVGFTGNDLGFTAARGFLLATGVHGPLHADRLSGRTRTVAFGINDGGQIVGAYANRRGQPEQPAEPDADADDAVGALTADRPRPRRPFH